MSGGEPPRMRDQFVGDIEFGTAHADDPDLVTDPAQMNGFAGNAKADGGFGHGGTQSNHRPNTSQI